jgi:peptidoglycan/LPS O-acetylase OafA/YrhL
VRNPYVDRLRGLSIVAVMSLHFAILLPCAFVPVPGEWIAAVARSGYYGVSMFFVISGFLITGKVLSRSQDGRQFSIRSFYAQRAGRIFPCLFLMVALAIALSLCNVPGFVIDQKQQSLCQILNYVLTFRFNTHLNWTGLPDPWKVLWSLSIEEVFYLSFPILFGILKKHWLIIPFLISIFVFGPFRRASLPGSTGLYDYFGCFDLIALGALTAFASRALSRHGYPQHLFRFFRWSGLAIVGFTYLRYTVLQNMSFGPSLIGIGAAIYLLGSAHGEVPSTRVAKMLRVPELFGQLSYELYLFHFFVLVGLAQLIAPLLKQWSFVGLSYFSLASVFCVLLPTSLFISKVFSEPANRAIRQLLLRTPSGLNPIDQASTFCQFRPWDRLLKRKAHKA